MSVVGPRYLILWPTAGCDLDCVYCYRRLRRGPRMSEETAEAALSLAAASGAPFHVQLAGGEPLLHPGLVVHVVEHVRREGWPASLAIQTNATRITPDIAQMLTIHGVQVGVSIDGPPAVQEQLRGHTGATLRGLSLLSDAGATVRVTTVVSRDNVAQLGELVMLLAAFPCVAGVALDPLVRLGSAADREDLAASPTQIIDGITRMHTALTQVNRVRRVPLQWRELERVRARLANPGVPALSSGGDFCHACRAESWAVTPSGDVFPCSQAVGDPSLRAGNVHHPEQIDTRVLRSAFPRRTLHGPCGCCPLQGRCPGDCPSRLSATPDDVDDAACVILRTLAHLELPVMARTRESLR